MSSGENAGQESGGYRHLFGPVPSRRLGRSLGVDLVPLKTCSFDCIFCQVGRTDHLTTRRSEYVDTQEVLNELSEWLAAGGQADYVTLSGSGEPTLHTGFGKVIEFIKEKSGIKSALLTNGTLLHLPEVLDAALKVDLAKISLGAWDQQSMEKLNRPEPGLTYEKLYSGIRAFSRQFEGILWIEVFLVAGVNDSPEHIRGISSRVNPLKADMVHLNTVVRPPSEDWAEPVGQAQMDRLAGMFEPRAELISAPRVDTRGVERSAEDAGIVRMIERRPCTIRDIAAATGVHINEVSKYLSHLVKSGRVKSVERDSETYYVKE